MATFTNYAGRVQQITKAIEPLGDAKPEWLILKRLGKKFDISVPYFETKDVFDAIPNEVPEFSGMTYESLGETGLVLGERTNGKENGRPLNQVPDKLRLTPIFE